MLMVGWRFCLDLFRNVVDVSVFFLIDACDVDFEFDFS